ncbi:MAG: hypothetical protein KDC98_04695 [Planctomycetes bacterium]|nr:hypothetical protein [Planctomycetota bacterium]
MILRHVATIAMTAVVAAQDKLTTEFGTIDWRRDFAAARTAARQEHKPLLLLFQEVPG